MTTIIVTHADQKVEQFHFGSDMHEISIGRRSINDVCIPDLSVSGQHARLVFDPEGVFVEDLRSTNGTYINGRLISRQNLGDQDEVVLGKVRLTYLADSPQTGQVRTQPSDSADAARPSWGIDHLDDEEDLDAHIVASARLESQPPDLDAGDDDGDLVYDRSSTTSGTYEPFTGAADESLSLSDRARMALGRDAGRHSDDNDDLALAEHELKHPSSGNAIEHEHPLDGLSARTANELSDPGNTADDSVAHQGAVIEIRNGIKSGQVLPIDKPVTTLGRPGIQIAAIMRKPDGFFLMHIESDDKVSRPTLNESAIGDEPVLLEHGDQLNVAGIDVQFLRP